jgi:hypothetical protein
MSVFTVCERAVGLTRGKRLILTPERRALLEALDYDGLIAAGAQEEAVTCARHFAAVRDSSLSKYPWVFARKTASLIEYTVNPLAALGWARAFALPLDCLTALAVITGDGRTFWREFEIIDGKLGANVGVAQIIYTARKDTETWGPIFEETFCLLLAREIALAVTGDAGAAAAFLQQAGVSLGEARAAGAIAPPRQPPFEFPGYQDYSGGT